MDILVVKGYVSHNRRLYGAGEQLKMDDSEATRLLAQGVAKAVETQPFSLPESQAEGTADGDESADDKEPGDKAVNMELPEVDATAAVKKAPARRGSKK